MTRKECESKIAEHVEAIIGIVKEYNPECKYLSVGFVEKADHCGYNFCNGHFHENSTDAKFPIDYYKQIDKTAPPAHPEITLHKDSQTGFYSIFVGDRVKYEHLAEDEVFGAMKEFM